MNTCIHRSSVHHNFYHLFQKAPDMKICFEKKTKLYKLKKPFLLSFGSVFSFKNRILENGFDFSPDATPLNPDATPLVSEPGSSDQEFIWECNEGWISIWSADATSNDKKEMNGRTETAFFNPIPSPTRLFNLTFFHKSAEEAV